MSAGARDFCKDIVPAPTDAGAPHEHGKAMLGTREFMRGWQPLHLPMRVLREIMALP